MLYISIFKLPVLSSLTDKNYIIQINYVKV